MSLIQYLAAVQSNSIIGLSISMAVNRGCIDTVAEMIWDMSCDNMKITSEEVGEDCLIEVIDYVSSKVQIPWKTLLP